MKACIVIFLMVFLVIPGSAEAQELDVNKILKGVFDILGNTSDEDDVTDTEDPFYEKRLVDAETGVIFTHRILSVSSDGISDDPDDYETEKIDMSESFELQEETKKIIILMDLQNPKEKSIRFKVSYEIRPRKGKSQTYSKTYEGGNMPFARFPLQLYPTNFKMKYRNKINVAIGIEGWEKLQTKSFTLINSK